MGSHPSGGQAVHCSGYDQRSRMGRRVDQRTDTAGGVSKARHARALHGGERVAGFIARSRAASDRGPPAGASPRVGGPRTHGTYHALAYREQRDRILPPSGNHPHELGPLARSYFEAVTAAWISFVSSWTSRVSAVFTSSVLPSLSSTSLICCSCAPRLASVASRFRSERLDDAPTRKPI